MEELDKASVQYAHLKVLEFINRLRQMMALELRHEAVSNTLDDGRHIELSHYLHELFDEHQVKMRFSETYSIDEPFLRAACCPLMVSIIKKAVDLPQR